MEVMVDLQKHTAEFSFALEHYPLHQQILISMSFFLHILVQSQNADFEHSAKPEHSTAAELQGHLAEGRCLKKKPA